MPDMSNREGVVTTAPAVQFVPTKWSAEPAKRSAEPAKNASAAGRPTLAEMNARMAATRAARLADAERNGLAMLGRPRL